MMTRINADNRTLADRYADAVLEKRALEAKVKTMRAAILDLGVDEVRGQYSLIVVAQRSQTRLDQDRVRARLTDKQYQECLITTPVTYVKIKGSDQE